MNEQESIHIIMKMIDRTKENLKEQSIFYLVWGWSIFIAASVEYALLMLTDYPHHYFVWPVAILFASASTIFLAAKRQKTKGVSTYADRALRYLWASWTVPLFFVITFAAFGGFTWATSYLFIIVLYGMGSTVSGGILNFKPLVYGGIFSFILAVIVLVVGLYTHFPTMLLFLSLSILGSFLIPGYLLRKS
jgi:hypothetical protein